MRGALQLIGIFLIASLPLGRVCSPNSGFGISGRGLTYISFGPRSRMWITYFVIHLSLVLCYLGLLGRNGAYVHYYFHGILINSKQGRFISESLAFYCLHIDFHWLLAPSMPTYGLHLDISLFHIHQIRQGKTQKLLNRTLSSHFLI